MTEENSTPLTGEDVKAIAKQQWIDRKGAGLNEYEVQSWRDANDNPVKIYFLPASLADRIAMHEMLQKRKHKSYWDLIAVEIVSRCLDSNGAKMFRRDEILELDDKYDPDVLAEIYSVVTGFANDISKDIAAAKKS